MKIKSTGLVGRRSERRASMMRVRILVAVFALLVFVLPDLGCTGLSQNQEQLFEGYIEGTLGPLSFGPGGLAPMRLSVQLVTKEGRYDLETSDQTRIVNLLVQNGNVAYHIGKGNHYNIRGQIASDRPRATVSSLGVIVASSVEYVEEPADRK